jgi:hypothetical protein
MTKINDPKYMTVLRECFTLNINMPGTLENEDPNKFIRSIIDFQNLTIRSKTCRRIQAYTLDSYL